MRMAAAILRAGLAVALVAAAAGAARADLPSTSAATMTAQAWMNAAHRSPPALDEAVALTELPFWSDGVRVCSGQVTDAAKLRTTLACLARVTGPFLAAAATWGAADLDHLPAPLRSARARLAPLAATHALVVAHAGADWAIAAVSYDSAAKATAVGALVIARGARAR